MAVVGGYQKPKKVKRSRPVGRCKDHEKTPLVTPSPGAEFSKTMEVLSQLGYAARLSHEQLKRLVDIAQGVAQERAKWEKLKERVEYLKENLRPETGQRSACETFLEMMSELSQEGSQK